MGAEVFLPGRGGLASGTWRLGQRPPWPGARGARSAMRGCRSPRDRAAPAERGGGGPGCSPLNQATHGRRTPRPSPGCLRLLWEVCLGLPQAQPRWSFWLASTGVPPGAEVFAHLLIVSLLSGNVKAPVTPLNYGAGGGAGWACSGACCLRWCVLSKEPHLSPLGASKDSCPTGCAPGLCWPLHSNPL